MKREMEYEININPQEVNTNCMDEWGVAYLFIDDNKGIEYNLCYDSGDCLSAFYKMERNDKGDMETDSDTYEHYEIVFDDENWKEKLIDTMKKIAEDFFKGGN